MLTVFVTNYWQLFVLRLLTGIALGGVRRCRGCRPQARGGPHRAAALPRAWSMHACRVGIAGAYAAAGFLIPLRPAVACAHSRATHAGALPVVFSLLGDLYDPSARAGVSSIVQLSTGVGLAFGQGVAGFVGPVAGWRWPFVIVAVPSVLGARRCVGGGSAEGWAETAALCACACARTAVCPPHSSRSARPASRHPRRSVLRDAVRVPRAGARRHRGGAAGAVCGAPGQL